MILGFAHITRNRVGKGPFPVANAPEKWPLMARRATAHSLAVRHPKEFITYDTGVVDQPSRLNVECGTVIVSVRDRRAESMFFCGGLGFVAESPDDWFIELPSPILRWAKNMVLRREASAPIDPPLDIFGFAALAFYSSDVEADRDRAIAAGGRTPTEPFFVTLERKMKIIMLRSPEGTIIELIEVQP